MTNQSNCQNRREAITALVLGELEPKAADELKKHMETCRTCRSLYQALADEEQTIRSAFAAITDRGQAIQQSLLQKSDNKSHQPSASSARLAPSSIFKNRTVRLAAAIILTAGIGIAVFHNALIEGPQGPGPAKPQTTLETELEKIEKMYAALDVRGLELMLLEGHFESKVAAANYLAEIGDSNTVEILEPLDAQYGDSEPAFGEAIDAIEDRTAVTATVPIEDSAAPNEPDTNDAQTTVATTQTTDHVLELVPAESLFCVRANNLDGTVAMIDQYLIGVSPMPAGAMMGARMQLAAMLGDPNLTAVDTAGNFAVFGLALEAEPTASLMDKMFIAGLVPFTDYAKFVSSNPNCGEPDANGVSIINSGGIMDPDKKMLITQVGTYGLITSPGAYDKLVSVAKSVSSGKAGLASSLDAGTLQAAKTEPLWAYVNVQRASKVFGPMLYDKLEQLGKQLETMNAGPQGGPAPAEAMNMYFGVLNILTEEVDSLSIAVNPKAEVLNLTVTVAAVPQTYLAKMFVADTSGQTNTLLRYLQDGAIFNFAIKVNTPFVEELSLTEFDFVSFLSDEGISDESAAKLEKLAADMVASAAGPGVSSFVPNEQGWPSFTGKYVIEIKDAEKWNKVVEAFMDIWDSGGFADLYGKMGIRTRHEFSPGADDYNDVSIDVVKFVMEAIDPNSAYGQLIDKVHGGGYEFRLAMVDRIWLCAFGGDCNSVIRQLIDQVKAGGPQQTPPEVASALATLIWPEQADFAGTANFIRYLNMAAAMLGNVQMDSMSPPITTVNVQTNSNIAFAGTVTDGKIAVEIALPKQHLLEIRAGLQTMQQQVMAIAARRQAISQLALADQAGTVTDYAVVQDANLSDEERAIKGLRTFSKIAGGRYPSNLDMMITMKEAGEALQKTLLLDPDRDPDAPLTQEEVMPKLVQIERASLFYAKLVQDGNDVKYYGTVTTEFPHVVLMHWKIAEDKHRVIFADLAVETVTAERLAELQALPLNLTQKAVKPDPADGAMAATVADLELSWMPGLNVAAHRVYLGTQADQLAFLAEVATEAYGELPELQTDAIYYWRVDEVAADGSVVVGDVWSFNTNKLCLWYKFDETGGKIVRDSSGNGYAGILAGENNWNADGYDGRGCLSFDDDTAISVPTKTLGSIDRQITISIRLYGYDSTGRDNFIFETGTNETFLRAAVPDVNNNVIFWAGGTEDVVTWNDSDSIDWRGSWKHYVFVKNAEMLRIYCDGRMVAEKTDASSSISGVRNQPFDIGALIGRMYDYKGKMDGLRIYNYALSQDEIAQIYSAAEPAWQQ